MAAWKAEVPQQSSAWKVLLQLWQVPAMTEMVPLQSVPDHTVFPQLWQCHLPAWTAAWTLVLLLEQLWPHLTLEAVAPN